MATWKKATAYRVLPDGRVQVKTSGSSIAKRNPARRSIGEGYNIAQKTTYDIYVDGKFWGTNPNHLDAIDIGKDLKKRHRRVTIKTVKRNPARRNPGNQQWSVYDTAHGLLRSFDNKEEAKDYLQYVKDQDRSFKPYMATKEKSMAQRRKATVTKKRKKNIAMGFYDAHGFHPIRASADYDSGRLFDDEEGSYRRAPRKRVAAKKKAKSSSKRKNPATKKKGTYTRAMMLANLARGRKIRAANLKKKVSNPGKMQYQAINPDTGKIKKKFSTKAQAEKWWNLVGGYNLGIIIEKI